MLRPDLTSLSDKLLRGGIAARHVKRYVRELSDHFDDLVREAMAGGKSAPEAERAAAARIGSVDQLAQTMLARDDLKSLGARYPWAVYGLGPLGSMVGCTIFLVLLIVAARAMGVPPLPPTIEQTVFDLLAATYTYVLPPVLAAIFVVAGHRAQRDRIWIMAGAIVLGLLGAGLMSDVVIYAERPIGARGELFVGFAWLPPFEGFSTALAKLIVNLAIVASVGFVMSRSRSPSVS